MRRSVIRVVLVLALLGSALLYGRLEKSVTVRIEGSIQRVRTFATTVGDALHRAGIPVFPHDKITPPLGASLRDGLTVRIWRAKEVTIILNGRPREVIVTALTVDELLRQVNLGHSSRDYLGASRSAPVYAGMKLEYRQAVAITVVHDDRTQRVITNDATVAQVLRDLGISLGKKDKILPGLRVYPRQGTVVRVLRVGVRNEVVDRRIPMSVQHRRMKSIEFGTSRVIAAGSDGIKVYRYLSTYVDGRRVKRKLLGSHVARKPVPRVIGIGAGFPYCPCKTGSARGQATWYDAYGLTAAHKTLPFGTVVHVVNLANGKSVNVVIRDRGPYAQGRIIDLSANAFSRLASLGKGLLDVKITW